MISVPEKLRQRVLSMAHDTLLGGHRGVAKTQDLVTSEFYWPGIHDDIRRYCWSCDVCQRNVSKGSVRRAHVGQMPLVETPYSTICVDLVGPLSPPSEGHRLISKRQRITLRLLYAIGRPSVVCLSVCL